MTYRVTEADQDRDGNPAYELTPDRVSALTPALHVIFGPDGVRAYTLGGRICAQPPAAALDAARARHEAGKAARTETCRRWNPRAGEWETTTAEIPPGPRRRPAVKRARTAGKPRDLSGLSGGAPLPDWWRDTAFAPSAGFADTRTFIKPPAIRTHRTPVAAFSGTPSSSR
jgi:hypothetical protein